MILKSWFLGIVLIGIGALALIPPFFMLWEALRFNAPITALGVVLNIAPGVGFLLAGVTILAKPARATIAFWIAPLWVPLFIGGAYALLPALRVSAVVIIVAVAFGYFAMLVFGFPAFLFLRARQWSTLRTTALVGAGAGLFVVYLGLALLLRATGAGAESWSVLGHPILLASALVGALVASTYWAVARPDRQPPANDF